MEKKTAGNRHNKQRHLILGVVLVLFGIAIITDLLNIGSWNFRNIVFSWQMLLIVLGIVFISSSDSKPTGYILIAVGGFFMIPKIFHDLPHYWGSLFWPVMLIILGLVIIFNRGKGGSISGRRSRHRSDSNEDYLDDVAIFGGGDKNVHSQNFKGGKITHIFGGSKYDFRNVILAEGTHDLELIMIFGGTKLIVPEGWDIRLEMTSVFGGFSDKRTRSIVVTDPDRTLVIKGVNMFGGGDIENF